MINLLSLILLIIATSYIILFFYSLYKQHNRLSASFSILCLSVAVYIFGYGLELRADNLENMKLLLIMQYFGASFLTTLWLLFSYKFHFNRNLKWQYNIVLFLVPATTLFLVVTNEFHHFFYKEVLARQYDGFIILQTVKGLGYYIHTAYSYLVFTIGVIIFYNSWRLDNYKLQTPSFWMLIGSLCPSVLNLAYLAGFSPYNIDLMPIGLGLFAICAFVVLFKFDFFELIDIVRSVVFSDIYEGIIVIDCKHRLIDFNAAAKKLFTWLNSKNIGLDLNTLEESKKIIRHQKGSFELEIIRDGTSKFLEFRITPLRIDKKILGYVYFILDITKHKKVLRDLNFFANYDSLTQIYNRRRLLEEAEKELLRTKRYGGCFSLLILDIDHFKKVNDLYGHMAGDEVLTAFAKLCKDRIRITDIIGRFGGEEFVILLSGTNKENAFKIAEDIRERTSRSEIVFNTQSIKITVSIGVVTVENNHRSLSIQQILNQADSALYKAKNSGRNKTCC